MSSASTSTHFQAPGAGLPTAARRWDEHACAYQDLMLELARIGVDIARRLKALGGDLPVFQQAAAFCDLARSARLCGELAYKLAQPLPAAKRLPPQHPAENSSRRDGSPSEAEKPATETRDREASERLEDPLREHNLDRPIPGLVADIKRGLARGAAVLPAAIPETARLQRATATAGSLERHPAGWRQPPEQDARENKELELFSGPFRPEKAPGLRSTAACPLPPSLTRAEPSARRDAPHPRPSG